MEQLMEQLARGPKPPPQPVCNNNCGQVFIAGPDGLIEITCPCGYGYYDSRKQEFIPGSLVRAGIRPSRQEYVAHVQQCPQQVKGAPIVSTIFHGAQPRENAIVPQSRGRDPGLPTRHATPTPSDRAHTEKSRDRSDRADEDEVLEEKTVSSTITRSRQPVFIPRENIEREALIYYLKLLGCNDVVLEKHTKEQRAGWLMRGFDLQLEALEWKNLLSDVIQDSRAWLREPGRSALPYEKSKAAARRKRDGPIRIQLQRRPSSSVNTRRPIRTPTQSLDNTPRGHSNTTEYDGEAAGAQKPVRARHDSAVDPASRHGARKNSSDYQPTQSQDNLSRHMKGLSLDSGIGGSPDHRSKPRRKSSSSESEEMPE